MPPPPSPPLSPPLPQYLLIIEHRTSDILTMYAQSQSAASGAQSASAATGPGGAPMVQEGLVQPAAARLNVQPPAWEDFDSDDDEAGGGHGEDDERPLTREELQRKTLRSSSKKDSKPGKSGKMAGKK